MAEKSLAFVRFMNLRSVLGAEQAEQQALHHDADLLLCYIYEQNMAEKAVIMTHLFHQKSFGAPPTIQRRIKELIHVGYVETTHGEDKRHRCLKLTNTGIAYLQKCSELLCTATISHM